MLKTTSRTSGTYFFAMICLYVFISFIGQSVLNQFFPQQNTAYVIISSTFSILAMLIVIVSAKATEKVSFKIRLNVKKFHPIYLVLSLILACGMFLGLGFVNNLVAKIFSVPSSDIAITTPTDLILYTVFLCLVPAVMEEFFFRGVILNGIKGAKWWVICLYVAVLFAVYHGSFAKLIYQLVYGFALTLLVLKSGSVFSSIITHFLNNFAVVLLTYLGINIDLLNPLLIVIGLVLLTSFFLGISLFEKNDFKAQRNTNGSFNGVMCVYTYFGIGLCVLIMILALL